MFIPSIRVAAGWSARLWAFFAALTLLAAMLLPGQARAEDGFLDPAEAFKFAARMQDPATIAVTFQIADGYYMYRERFQFTATGAKLGTPAIPPGKVHYDKTFEKDVETYRGALTILIPVEASGAFTLVAGGQGCSDKGLCYPPQEYRSTLTGAAIGGMSTAAGSAPAAPVFPGAAAPLMDVPGATAAPLRDVPAPVAVSAAPSDMGTIEAALKGGKLLVILPLFLLLGLGLSFTPCVLPMVPILSFIIVGEGAKSSRARGLLLSATYALGMAIVYTALGVAAGLIGEGLAAALQNPWVLGAFALLMAGLSLSMFGFYELQVPAVLQEKLTTASNRQSSGKLAGVFVMGAISALIVGPCVAAPLAGALLYISQSRDVVIGGAALFAMAVGMSVPLLLVGVSAGALLPRAGAWMDAVKRCFGVLMLAMGWWLVSPVLPGAVQMLGWTALLVGYGMYLLSGRGNWAGKSVGLVLAALGLMQLVGVVSGGRDALAPLAHLRGGAAQQHGPAFVRVKSIAELDAALAANAGKGALLDFYADWCVSCKEMEKLTFVAPPVKARMDQLLLLQVDVTANNADDKALLKKFNLFGPPGIILFDPQGRELADARVIGYQNPEKFLASLGRLN